MIILVSLKTDNGEGSAVVACMGIKKDPLFPRTHVILENVQGVSWPFNSVWLGVKSWSINKQTVNYWMAGPLMKSASLTEQMLSGELTVPHPPGTLPVGELNNNTAEVDQLLAQAQELDKADG